MIKWLMLWTYLTISVSIVVHFKTNSVYSYMFLVYAYHHTMVGLKCIVFTICCTIIGHAVQRTTTLHTHIPKRKLYLLYILYFIDIICRTILNTINCEVWIHKVKTTSSDISQLILHRLCKIHTSQFILHSSHLIVHTSYIVHTNVFYNFLSP